MLAGLARIETGIITNINSINTTKGEHGGTVDDGRRW